MRLIRKRQDGPTQKLRRSLIAFGFLFMLSAIAVFAESYNWKSVAIHGGGFVTGIITHPNASGVVYARTDIGGAYRWDSSNSSWIPLLDFAANNSLHGIESIAIDPSDSNRVYIAAGRSTPGVILASTNQGANFFSLSFSNNVNFDGNADGRNNGERMAVDPNSNNILFYGTRQNGLFKSVNYGSNWTQVAGFPVNSTPNNVGLVFVEFVQSSGTPGSPTPVIFVGVSRSGGTNLFRSTNGGTNWTHVPTVASTVYMPHHAAQDGLGNMYITFNNNQGPNNITNGNVIKLNLATLASSNVTPPKDAVFPEQGGFAGVSVDRQHPTNIVVSTMDRWWPPPFDQIYRSVNGGASWTTTAVGLPGNASAPWSVIRTPHWAGDVEIDPFNSNRAWYVTGYGIFSCNNLMTGTGNWTFTSDGLEEFYTFCVVSPPSGPWLYSSHGDQGSFRHVDLDTSPPTNNYFPHAVNSFGIDFAENNPNLVVRLFQDSPFGAYSTNSGVSWTDFPTSPPGATGNQPPSNIAISADGGRIVWIPQNSIAYYSTNKGVNWTASTGGPTATRVPISDRVNSNKFYIYSNGSFYVSTNGGATFAISTTISSGLTPRTVFGREGHVWLPRGTSGLSRSTNSGTSFTTVASVQRASFIGFGMTAPGQSYPAIFISGRVTNVDGIFRSDDEGVSWVRINDDQHQFTLSNIHSFCGDPRVYGRVYFGTEGRGIFYGEPVSLPDPPAAPPSLIASAGDSEVLLNWTAAAGATNYYVKRSTISGGTYATVATNAGVVLTNTGLNNGTVYYFVVSALNAGGQSAHSPEASARPIASAPTPVGIASLTTNQFQLTWPASHTGWKLQVQTNTPGEGLGTNWSTLSGSDQTNVFTVPMDPVNGSVFFRLIHP